MFIGNDSKVDTPVPIPNTEVKHFNAEDSVSENRKLPIFFCLSIRNYVRLNTYTHICAYIQIIQCQKLRYFISEFTIVFIIIFKFF